MTAPPRSAPPPARSPHLSGVFAPVAAEVDVPGLEVVGEVPRELDGAYLRNGPNPRFRPIGRYVHPLDGDGMLHRVVLRDGQARYTNRFVRTAAVNAEEAAGHAQWAGVTEAYRPGTEVVGPALAGTARERPDINVVRHAGRLLALADSDRPYRLDADLGTRGRETFGGTQPVGITAHPRIDPRTGEMVVFCYGVRPPFLTWSTVRADGHAGTPVPVEGVDRPVMVHDMALTVHYVVLVVCPLFVDLDGVLAGGPLLSWEPEAGARIALVPRDGGPVRWCEDDAFWMWHAAGAYELDDPATGNPVVLDYVQWERPVGLIPGDGHGVLARAVLDPAAGTATRAILDDDAVEFPRIDDRLLTGRHRIVATAAFTGRAGPGSAPDALCWFDVDAGTRTRWAREDLVMGEAAFAPDPAGDAPDRGWWMTFATCRRTGDSRLLVFPAADPAGGPIAEVRIPVRVPLGLHGNWLPAEDGQ